jgi:hypothetical protein
MRADALAQALVARKWTQVMLLVGPGPADAQRGATAQEALRRYGLKVVATRPFKLSADPRERELANPLLLTRGIGYDAVWVVDSDGEFARGLPYRTALPRPVVGDAGLVTLAWQAQFERYGAPQVSRRFAKATGRAMTDRDASAWVTGKALVTAAIAAQAASPQGKAASVAAAAFDQALADAKVPRAVDPEGRLGPVRDTTPVIQISGVTFGVVVVAAGSPLRSLDELFDWAREHPGRLMIATNGVGTTPHLVLDELFARQGLAYVHVPYKGTAEQMIAVTSGQVQVGVNSNGFAPFVDSGRLRLLVTFGEQRTRRWPQVPTLKELGHGIVATSPYGLAGPRVMAPAVVQTLHDAFKTAAHDPIHLAELAQYDQELNYLGPDDYGRAMRDAYLAEKRAVERLGLARSGS